MDAAGASFVLALIAFLAFAASIVAVIVLYNYLTLFAVKGANQEVLVVVNGRTGIITGHPEDPRSGNIATVRIGLLDRIDAAVFTTMQNVQLIAEAGAQRAPQSAGDRQQEREEEVRVMLNIAFGIKPWVPFMRNPNYSWDHGHIESAARKLRLADEGWGWYVPGAVVVASLFNYKEGEHYRVLERVISVHLEQLIGTIDIQDLLDTPEEELNKLHYDPPPQVGRAEDLGPIDYPYNNAGELLQGIAHIMTEVTKSELMLYGIAIYQISVQTLNQPKTLVAAHRDKLAATDRVKAAQTMAEGLQTAVQNYVEATGSSPGLSTLALQQASGVSPSLFSQAVSLIDYANKRFKGKAETEQ